MAARAELYPPIDPIEALANAEKIALAERWMQTRALDPRITQVIVTSRAHEP